MGWLAWWVPWWVLVVQRLLLAGHCFLGRCCCHLLLTDSVPPCRKGYTGPFLHCPLCCAVLLPAAQADGHSGADGVCGG